MASAARDMAANRSSGTVRLSFMRSGTRDVLRDSFQQGCLRVRLPRETSGGTQAVLMNTAGGLACGDRLDQALAWEAGTAVAVTTQAAEKVYRAIDGGATVVTRLRVAAGATAEWLPQETILFDGARLTRDIAVDMSDDARFVGVEMVVLGRAAMGETMRHGGLVDRWRVRRGGRLIYADAVRIEGDAAAAMARPALGGGATAFATILCVAPDVAGRLDAVRAVLDAAHGAASAWDGMLAVRLLARDAAMLRRMLLLALEIVRDGRKLPRSWMC